MKIRRKKGDLKSNRARSMECIKFIGVDPTTAGSYNSSSHAGSYPSSRVCIPERCFTKCMHCIEFNHPPQKNQFFRPVVVPRPFHGCFKASKKKNDREKDPPLPKFRDIGFYQPSKSRSIIFISMEVRCRIDQTRKKFGKFLILRRIDVIISAWNFNLLEIA